MSRAEDRLKVNDMSIVRSLGKKAGWKSALFGVLMGVAGFTAIDSVQAAPGDRPNPREASQALTKLTNWLECVACSEADVSGLKKYGQSIVPMLIATLNSGLSLAARESLENSFAERYDLLAEQARNDPKFAMKSTKKEFVSRYVGYLDEHYRIRATQALGGIGGTRARNALERALKEAEQPGLRRAIEKALGDIR
jgi:hypothetical protein